MAHALECTFKPNHNFTYCEHYFLFFILFSNIIVDIKYDA